MIRNTYYLFACFGYYCECLEMMKKLFVGLLISFIIGCASAPNWEGMSEREISQWKSRGFDASQAQNWRVRGFDAAEANGWVQANFSLETATIWAKESFNVEEAQVWSEAGFDIEDAVTNRSKGLTPVRAN